MHSDRDDAERGLTLLLTIAVRLYREGLHALLSDAGMNVHSVDTALAAVDAASRLQPDIILLDTRLADALSALRVLLEVSPASRVVALGVDETDREIIAWAEAGISGYIGVDATLEMLVATIRSVAAGELLCSPRVAALLLRHVGRGHAGSRPERVRLTTRELDIVRLIDEGASNKEIATRLKIELSTVKNHVHRILEKTGVADRLQAAARLRPLVIGRRGSSTAG